MLHKADKSVWVCQYKTDTFHIKHSYLLQLISATLRIITSSFSGNAVIFSKQTTHTHEMIFQPQVWQPL